MIDATCKPAGSDIAQDALGRVHAGAGPDARVVCLVPSITELFCELGLADRLVGRTGFCVHPRARVRAIPRVGGTKTVDIEAVRRLAPTHLIVNIDENEKPVVEQLAAFVPHVVVTHPLGPEDNRSLYRLIGAIFGRRDAAEALVQRFDAAFDSARSACAVLPCERVLYLIWKDPWMTVSRDTYIARTLAAVGWDTLAVPADARYPVVDPASLPDGTLDHVLLSTEPYAFRDRDARAFAAAFPGLPAPRLIDGEMTSWYGPRAIGGFAYLADLRRTLRPAA